MYRVTLLLRVHKLLIRDLHQRREHLTRGSVQLEEAVLFEQRVFTQFCQVEEFALSVVAHVKDLFERLYCVERVAMFGARRRDDGVGARLDGIGDVAEVRGSDLDV